MKGSFYGRDCGIDPIFEVEEKIRATKTKILLKAVVGLNTRLLH